MKRIFALLLTLATLLSVLSIVACSGKKQPTTDTETSEKETTASATTDDDYDLTRFNGADTEGVEEIHLMSRAHTRHADEITCEDSSDAVLHSIYSRQLWVEETLNVSIINNKVEASDEHGGRTMIQNLIATNDSTYDLYASSYYGSSTLAVEGLFRNLYEVNTVDTERSYYSQYFTEKSQIGDNLYMITGDAAISATRFLFVTFFNKKLVADLDAEDPFQLVYDGDWTFDKMYSIIAELYTDTDGDGTVSSGDTYGLGVNNYLGVDAYTSAFDLMCVTINEDKQAELTLDSDKYGNAVDKLYNLFWKTNGVLNKQDPDGIATVFAENRLYFSQSWLYNVESTELRNMENSYGIIPYPKYDSNQEDYYSFGHDQITIFALPRTGEHPNVAGLVLEALSAGSKDTVLKQYYDIALRVQYAPDPDSSYMIDLIRKNFRLDTGWVYCEDLELVSRIMRTLIEAKTKNFSNYYAKYKETYQTAVDNLNTAFGVGTAE